MPRRCSRMNATVGRVEPDVDGIEHRAEHRHPEACLVDRAHVRREDRHAVPDPDAAPGERASEAAAARVRLGPGEAALAVDDGGVVGIDGGSAFDEGQGGERREVRGGAVKARFERGSWNGLRSCSMLLVRAVLRGSSCSGSRWAGSVATRLMHSRWRERAPDRPGASSPRSTIR